VAPIKGKGRIKWRIEDDDGVIHTIKLKDSLYVPAFMHCLLCSQHWSQVSDNHFPQQDRTWQASFIDMMVLYWDQHQYKKTIPWSPQTNTGQFMSAPGATDYWVYAAATDADNQVETYEHVCFQANQDNTHVTSDDGAPGATHYWVYAAATDADNQVETHEHVCFQANQDNTHLTSDDEDDTGTDNSEQPHKHMPYEPSSR
jgi:hypothetical protein